MIASADDYIASIRAGLIQIESYSNHNEWRFALGEIDELLWSILDEIRNPTLEGM